MQTTVLKQVRRTRRKAGIRKHVVGSAQRPRLTIFRSLKHIYAQVIDDLSGKTLASASTVREGVAKGANKTAAEAVGKALAERAKAAGIAQVAFDRNGFKYHGRVKALADAARKEGLKF